MLTKEQFKKCLDCPSHYTYHGTLIACTLVKASPEYIRHFSLVTAVDFEIPAECPWILEFTLENEHER